MDGFATLDWQRLGAAAPWIMIILFLGASALMIWRLECLSEKGFEGTVLGTLIMPYCSGIGNLVFAWVMGRQSGASSEVLTNCLVNNVTNLTLLIGLPTVIWGQALFGKKKKLSKAVVRTEKINRLSLLLTLTAALFFTGTMWALGLDGRFTFSDGLVLTGMFLFWQCFHVFEVMKSNVRLNRTMSWTVYPELIVLALGAVVVFFTIDGLVGWMDRLPSGTAGIRPEHLGWLSAWLMVLPNALLALYYGWRGQPEVVYASQVGDGHICIPLCIGVYAMLATQTSAISPIFNLSIQVLVVALLLNLVLVLVFGKLPRMIGWVFLAGYGLFLWKGFPG